LLSEQSNKESSHSWREADRFSAQNGKDEPIPRAARARQELRTAMLEENVDEKVMYVVYMSID
jgi:hypothetical protein